VDQAGTLRVMAQSGDPESSTKVIAVTSGKGGVGKTNVVANLAFALTKLRKRVLVVDADLGLANLDILLGLTPRYTIEHLFQGTKSLRDIVIEGPGGMRILPASSGVQHLTELSAEQKLAFLAEVDSLEEPVDVMLIDTGAGISSNVLYFVLAAQDVVVVTCPEPTAITDAYALMKVLAREHDHRKFQLVVNSANSAQEAEMTFQKLNRATQQFLDISINLLGWIPYDAHVQRLAMAIGALPPVTSPSGQIQFFWQRLFR
jgi:flagellar biosynthesis protein FlhG